MIGMKERVMDVEIWRFVISLYLDTIDD